MAIFGGQSDKAQKERALRRVLERTWTDSEGRRECLQELQQHIADIRPGELSQLLGSPDGMVRSFSESILRERMDARGIGIILQSLNGHLPRARQAILHALVRNKPDEALPRLQEMVMTGERDIAITAMEALSTLPPHKVGGGFLEFLNHERKEIRSMALARVQQSPELRKSSSIRQTIVDLIDDTAEDIRVRALDILSDFDHQEAVRICLRCMKDPAVAVQQKAVSVLETLLTSGSGLDHDTADDELLTLLTDGSAAVRNGVLQIVMKRPDRETLIRKLLVFCDGLLGWARDRTLDSLKSYADELVETVVTLMADPDEDVRAMALMAGATLERAETVPHVITMLDDEDWWIRMIATETLGNIGDASAVPALIERLSDPDINIAAAEALARIGDPSALKPLLELYKKSEATLRLDLVDRLQHFGRERVAPLMEQIAEKDPSDAVKQKAKEIRKLLLGEEADGTSEEFHITDHIRERLERMSPIERLLAETRELQGSDLHVIVGSPPLARIHGELEPFQGEAYTSDSARETIEAILTERDLGILRSERQVDFCHSIPEVGRYRFNVYEDRRGLAASARVIPNRVPTISDINLPPHLGDLVNHTQGLVVVSGASGMGKSTTLAALVNLFNERTHSHIVVFEDPIEFVHPAKGCLVNQRAVGVHTRSFPAALRGALREDPDVIVVGEMRDTETVRLAIEASETGHLVIATMNTPSAPKTVDRIIDAFPVSEQTQVRTMLSETLKAVIAQQLLPRADGTGRVACFEVLMATLSVRNLIREDKTYQLIGQMQIGESSGHITLDRALGRLVDAGWITPEIAWMKAQNKELFEGRVRPDFLAGQFQGI